MAEGGRGHVLIRRSYNEYQHAFDYSYYIMSRGRVNRTAELRYLQNYKNKIREEQLKKNLKTFIYKKPDGIDEIRSSLIDDTDIENQATPKSQDDQSGRKSSKFQSFRKRLSLRRRRNS